MEVEPASQYPTNSSGTSVLGLLPKLPLLSLPLLDLEQAVMKLKVPASVHSTKDLFIIFRTKIEGRGF
jgi:hypothetical protein